MKCRNALADLVPGGWTPLSRVRGKRGVSIGWDVNSPPELIVRIVVSDTQKARYFPLQACYSAVGNQVGFDGNTLVRAGKGFQA